MVSNAVDNVYGTFYWLLLRHLCFYRIHWNHILFIDNLHKPSQNASDLYVNHKPLKWRRFRHFSGILLICKHDHGISIFAEFVAKYAVWLTYFMTVSFIKFTWFYMNATVTKICTKECCIISCDLQDGL